VQTLRSRWRQAPDLPRTLVDPLSARFHAALNALVAVWPGAFEGTDLDPAQTLGRMEKLVARVEKLLAEHAPRPVAASLSPAERLAQQWRDRLAANTLAGGKPGESEELKWRAAEQEVKSAQQQWSRLGPVAPDAAAALNDRFQRACRRFFDQRRRVS